MMTPRFSAPSGRMLEVQTGFVTGAFPSSPDNTCACSGDQTYNKPHVTRNDCSPGYYPVCDSGAYNSGCGCAPQGG